MTIAAPGSEDSNRKLLAIFLVVLIDVLGMTILIPILPFYSEHFGASTTTVGLILSVYAVCQLISGPILGHWSDRIGRKPVLIVSQIGTFIGFIILAQAQSLTLIFISRIIDGLTAGNLSTAQAYITDHTSPQNRAKSLAKISIAFGIGFFIGPAMTAFLYKYGYQAPIYAAAGLSFLSIMASTFLLPKEGPPGSELQKNKFTEDSKPRKMWTIYKDLIVNPKLKLIFLELFIFYFAFSTYMAGFALFSERQFRHNGAPLTPTEVGYAVTYFGFLGIIIQGFLIGRLVKRFGEKKLALMGFVSSMIGYAWLTFISGPLMIAVTGLFTSFGAGVLRPVLLSSLTAEAPPKERGSIIGLNNSIQSIAPIIAPVINTALLGTY